MRARHELLNTWTAVDDRVRGGSSVSYLKPSAGVTNGAVFYGNLDTKTLGGAGFASQATKPSSSSSFSLSNFVGSSTDDLHWDLSGYDGIELRLGAFDKKTYTFTIKDTVPDSKRADGRERDQRPDRRPTEAHAPGPARGEAGRGIRPLDEQAAGPHAQDRSAVRTRGRLARWAELRNAEGPVDPCELESLWSDLDTVLAADILGDWRGFAFSTGHPVEKLLGRSGWYGQLEWKTDRLSLAELAILVFLDPSLPPISTIQRAKPVPFASGESPSGCAQLGRGPVRPHREIHSRI